MNINGKWMSEPEVQAYVSRLENKIQKYDKAISRDIELIDWLRTMPQNRWISVKDRLPEIGKSVLIYYPKWDGDEIQVAKLEDDGMMFDICGEFNIGTGVITHWMPLPEPPKDGDAE